MIPALAEDLQTRLLQFQSERDLSKKEKLLLDITVAHPDAGSALLKIAKETSDSDTRWLAIRGIGWLKFRAAIPFLKQSLYSKSAYDRACSAAAIGLIKDPAATADLINILGTEQDSRVIEQIALALQSLGAKVAIPALKSKVHNPSPQTRIWILGAIGALGSKRDVPFIATFLFDENQTVAASAAREIELLTGANFDFPHSEQGPCSFGDGVRNAQQWWKTRKNDPEYE